MRNEKRRRHSTRQHKTTLEEKRRQHKRIQGNTRHYKTIQDNKDNKRTRHYKTTQDNTTIRQDNKTQQKTTQQKTTQGRENKLKKRTNIQHNTTQYNPKDQFSLIFNISPCMNEYKHIRQPLNDNVKSDWIGPSQKPVHNLKLITPTGFRSGRLSCNRVRNNDKARIRVRVRVRVSRVRVRVRVVRVRVRF
jgi:hypothetical protein